MRTCTPRSRQVAHLRQRAVQRPLGQRPDQVGGFGNGDEFVGTDRALRGMEPAQQRFGAFHHAAAQIHLRLEMQLERVAGDGRTQLAADRELAHGVFVVRRVVVLEGGAAALGHVHGHVRVAQQRLRVTRVVRIMRDADAHAHFDRDSGDIDGRAQAIGEQLRGRRDGLVARARPSTTVNSSPPMRAMNPRSPSAVRESLRDVAQHPVADVVAQRVVHFLEAAQVEHEQRQRRAHGLQAERGLEVRQQRGAIRQPGE